MEGGMTEMKRRRGGLARVVFGLGAADAEADGGA